MGIFTFYFFMFYFYVLFFWFYLFVFFFPPPHLYPFLYILIFFFLNYLIFQLTCNNLEFILNLSIYLLILLCALVSIRFFTLLEEKMLCLFHMCKGPCYVGVGGILQP